MAGVPVRAMEGYLTRLVQAGHTVAICEQMQDPREVKGIVDRDVVRVVSPGTLVDEASLDGAEPLFVLAVSAGAPRGRDKKLAEADRPVGLAWADISTGAFRAMTTTVGRFAEELPASPGQYDVPTGARQRDRRRSADSRSRSRHDADGHQPEIRSRTL